MTTGESHFTGACPKFETGRPYEQIENGIGGQGGILRQMGKGDVLITPKAKKVFQVQA
jgi:hypothetical protein